MECTLLSGNNYNDWTLVKPQSKNSLKYCHSVISPAPSAIAKGGSAASNHYFALEVMNTFLLVIIMTRMQF